MSGSVGGGKRAAATIKATYGKDFFAEIGARGGRMSRTGGFAAKIRCFCTEVKGKHHRAQCAGRLGGRISRRGSSIKHKQETSS